MLPRQPLGDSGSSRTRLRPKHSGCSEDLLTTLVEKLRKVLILSTSPYCERWASPELAQKLRAAVVEQIEFFHIASFPRRRGRFKHKENADLLQSIEAWIFLVPIPAEIVG